MKATTEIYLKSQADRRLKRGHLWLYSNEIDIQKSPIKNMPAGTLVNVLSASGQFMGVAFINPNTLLCGRMVSREPTCVLNAKFFERRITQALALRERCFDQPYYRLVYGDSDFLPGVVIDRYGDQLVAQISVAGMDQLQEPLIAGLERAVNFKGLVVRNNHAARELEQLEEQVDTIGEVSDTFEVLENGCRFHMDPVVGQKTGWFYDHRLNRAMLKNWVGQGRVLDVFSYLGGWGVQAAVAGASSVVCVDASQTAIDGVAHNAALNDVSEKVSGIKGKAVDVLKTLLADGEKFDCVILDPPAFIKRRKDQRSGEAAYRHINELAIRLLENNGLLVSASCSMSLQADTLMDTVRGAARANSRQAQLIYQGGQGPDHPIHPAIPETSYLKAQFYQITT